MKYCPRCDSTKPLDDFNKNKNRYDGHQGYCRPCQNSRNVEWQIDNRDRYLALKKARYNSNKEKHNEGVRRWQKENPKKMAAIYARYTQNHKEKIYLKNHRRRIKVKSNTLVVLDKEIKRLYSSNCIHCGTTENITMDHLIPVSRGGRHSIGNLVPMCRSCNSRKGKRLYAEWRYEDVRASKS